MKDNLTKKVIPQLDSNFGDYRKYINAPIYKGKIDNEIEPPLAPKCFLGAYYDKVLSSVDNWLGIEGTITLGEFIPDEKRYGTDNRIFHKRYLDSPSIYMGGKALFESDAGLGMNIGYTSNDTSVELNYGSPKVAYRPFWRFIYSEIKDENFNVLRRDVNSWNTANVKDLDFYYFPGDKIKMSIFSPLDNYLQFRVELLERTKIEKYESIRNAFKLKEHPRVFYSPLFHSEGHGAKKAEFKRVNAIDQYGNEGFIVKETNAKVTKATWENTYLFREIDGKVCRVAFSEERHVSMHCPNEESFTIKKLKDGGEQIEIHPSYKPE